MDNKTEKKDEKMWAMLFHLGSNMWGKPGECHHYEQEEEIAYHDSFYCDMDTWRKATEFLPECGINTIVIDIGEGIRFDSHPEMAVKGNLTKAEMKEELERLRGLGLTPLPKFNFSSTHNGWMEPYSNKMGSEEFRRVSLDIIDEMIELFGRPKFFHLGLEEEIVENQKYYPVKIERSWKQKTEDALAMFDACRKKGVRPWMWVDPQSMPGFGGPERFRENIPKDVLISNWYYSEFMEVGENEKANIRLYREIEEWGYEQMPCGSNWICPQSLRQTMKFCKNNLKDEKILGYMTSTWRQTRPENYNCFRSAAHLLGQAKKEVY